jgi:hypothetical protein
MAVLASTALAGTIGTSQAYASEASQATASIVDAPASAASNDQVTDWFMRSDAAKASQPHWMTPLVTVTPRLEQEFRYDQGWQVRSGGVDLDNYDSGKGLELIPSPHTEVILGVPAYEVRSSRAGRVTGWSDESLLLKYRILSADEQQGNYILTGFLGLSLPSGDVPFTNTRAVLTPTIAAGKGWGSADRGLDVQSTLGIGIPLAQQRRLGTTTVWNASLQAHVLGKLWPEFESTYSVFTDGPNAGKRQWALTTGLILGRFDLGPRARLIVGGGYQWTVSTFRLFNHSWLGTLRIAF